MNIHVNDHEIAVLKTAMVIQASFFASILYEKSKLQITDDEGMWRGEEVETAMTNGYHIVFNKKWFFSLPVSGQVFVCAHEIVHLFSRHPQRFAFYGANGFDGDRFNDELAQLCADAVINKLLRASGIGVQIGGINWEDELAAMGYTLTGLEPWEDLYRFLMNRAKEKGHNPNKGPTKMLLGPTGAPADGIGKDIGDPATAKGQEASEMEMKAAVSSALKAAQAQGELPGALKSLIDDFLAPQEDWRTELRDTMSIHGEPEHYSWRRANRRKLYKPGVVLPRRVGASSGHGIIGVDTSGSISDRNLSQFGGEMSSILALARPKSLHIIWCDAQVDRVDKVDDPSELEHIMRVEGVPGRGGTSFIPPFEYVRDNKMDCDFFVYMTDLYGPVPDASLQPCQNVIWLVVNNEKSEGPFGRTIHLKEEKG